METRQEPLGRWLSAIPVRSLLARDPAKQGHRLDTPEQVAQRRAADPGTRLERLEECGHMLH
ncbi:MAG: hypothetical protein ACK5YO_30635, partial [Planctomyces sp.]